MRRIYPTSSFLAGIVLGLALVVFPAPLSAQTITDGRVWWNVTVQERAGTASPWRWYLETQGRHRDGTSDVDQMLIRPAVGYDLTSRSSVWIGYGYTPGYPATGGTLTENRAWQQYMWNGPALGSVVQSRTRVEQRSIEGNDAVAWRLRQFSRVTKPVARRAGLAVVVWDELFVHVNDTRRTPQGFDQNRVFAGVGLSLAPAARLEVGYVNQAIRGGPTAVNRRHHIVLGFLNLTY
jgi:hypothetical protein